MASTVAYDTSRVEEWPRDADEEAARRHPIDPSLDHLPEPTPASDETTGETELPRWPRRGPHAALLELGPARPGALAIDEAWPRVVATADFEPVGAPRDFASDVDAGPATAGGDGASAGSATHELPPPPPARPSRPMPILTEELPSRPAILEMVRDTRLAENDAAGGEIVRLLASVNIASPEVAASVDPMMIADADPMDAPPMIIERARAEQALGMVADMPRIAQLNPVPGLAAGFALSLVAGAVLYAMLTSG